MEKGPIVYNNMRGIIIEVDKDELENILKQHALNYLEEIGECVKHIALDGKTIRGSFNYVNEQKASHMLNVLVSKHNLLIGQKDTTIDKTNEIPVTQGIIRNLDLTNVIFTADALHCQKKTVQDTLNTGNHLFVQVKGNQEHLLNQCKHRTKINRNYINAKEHEEKGHGRIENRQTSVYYNNENILPKAFRDFKTLIRIRRKRKVYDTREKKYKLSIEDSFYLCTKVISPADATQIAREHWGIENRLHNVLDNTFQEDSSRIRVCPEIMTLLRGFALNILRMNGKENISQTRTEMAYNKRKLAKLSFLWN